MHQLKGTDASQVDVIVNGTKLESLEKVDNFCSWVFLLYLQ